MLRKAETEGRYYIISGERRFRATLLNGSNTIKAIVRDKFNAEDIGYLQMAENMKRADLTVVEIAEFVCARTELGEKQADISEKLGLDKGQISKYCAWREMPECLKEAVKTKKLGSIQAAHALFKTWEEYPKETEEFLESKERISTSEAKKFDPKSWYVPTFSDQEDTSQASVQESEEPVSEPTDLPVMETDSVSKDTVEDLEEVETKNSGTEINDALANLEEVEISEASGSIENYEGKTTTDEEEHPDEPEELETAADDFLQGQSEESTYKKPLILCLIEGRECELLYKKKTLDGFVVVKYEDGTEEEVPAEDVTLNRIIEA